MVIDISELGALELVHWDVVSGVLISLDGCVLISTLAGVRIQEVVEVDTSESNFGSPRSI